MSKIEVSPYGRSNEQTYLPAKAWLAVVGRILLGLIAGRRVSW